MSSYPVFRIFGWCQSTSQHQAGCGGSWWLCSKCTPPPNLSVSDSPDVKFFKWIPRTDQTLANCQVCPKLSSNDTSKMVNCCSAILVGNIKVEEFAKYLWNKIFGTDLSLRLELHRFPPEFAPDPQHLHISSTLKYFIHLEIFHPPWNNAFIFRVFSIVSL